MTEAVHTAVGASMLASAVRGLSYVQRYEKKQKEAKALLYFFRLKV